MLWIYELVFFTNKKSSLSFIKLQLNYSVLTVVVPLLSMEGQKSLGFHKNYLNLCSEDKWRTYRFETAWGRVINDISFYFGEVSLLKQNSSNVHYRLSKRTVQELSSHLHLCHKSIKRVILTVGAAASSSSSRQELLSCGRVLSRYIWQIYTAWLLFIILKITMKKKKIQALIVKASIIYTNLLNKTDIRYNNSHLKHLFTFIVWTQRQDNSPVRNLLSPCISALISCNMLLVSSYS